MTMPSYIDAGAATTGTGATSPPVGTHIADDTLVLVVATANEVVTNPGGGWVAGPIVSFSAQIRITIFTKVTAGGEAAPTIPDPGDHCYSQIFTIRNAHLTKPFAQVLKSRRANDSTGVVVWPGFDSKYDDCFVMHIVGWSADANAAGLSAPANATLANLTERSDGGTLDGNGSGFAVVTGEAAAAGSIDETTGTLAGAYANLVMLTLVIAPRAVHTLADVATIDGAAAPNGGNIYLYDKTQPEASGLAVLAVTAGGAGAYSCQVPYDDHEYIAIFANGTTFGASAPDTVV